LATKGEHGNKPISVYLYAEDYRIAADTLRESPPKGARFDAPVRFLYYHATEIYLKSSLLAKGCSEKMLKNVGHQSDVLGRLCQQDLELSDDLISHMAAVRGLDDLIDSRYFRNKLQLVGLEDVREVCHQVRDATRRFLRGSGYPLT
jgi:hypothetical protein